MCYQNKIIEKIALRRSKLPGEAGLICWPPFSVRRVVVIKSYKNNCTGLSNNK